VGLRGGGRVVVDRVGRVAWWRAAWGGTRGGGPRGGRPITIRRRARSIDEGWRSMETVPAPSPRTFSAFDTHQAPRRREGRGVFPPDCAARRRCERRPGAVRPVHRTSTEARPANLDELRLHVQPELIKIRDLRLSGASAKRQSMRKRSAVRCGILHGGPASSMGTAVARRTGGSHASDLRGRRARTS
jgi:hypothetical protein